MLLDEYNMSLNLPKWVSSTLIHMLILDKRIGNDTKYEPAGHNHYGSYGASVSNTEYEMVELTAFGRLFLNACIEKTEPDK